MSCVLRSSQSRSQQLSKAQQTDCHDPPGLEIASAASPIFPNMVVF